MRPIFRADDLVQQCLVRLAGSGLVLRMNQILSGLEGSRRADFAGSTVAHVEFGMLVEDMRKRMSTACNPQFCSPD